MQLSPRIAATRAGAGRGGRRLLKVVAFKEGADPDKQHRKTAADKRPNNPVAHARPAVDKVRQRSLACMPACLRPRGRPAAACRSCTATNSRRRPTAPRPMTPLPALLLRPWQSLLPLPATATATIRLRLERHRRRLLPSRRR